MHVVGSDEMVAGLADVENGVEIGGLPGRGEDAANATFESVDLIGNGVVGRVLKPCVEIS